MTAMHFEYAGLAILFHGERVTVASTKPDTALHDRPWTGAPAELLHAVKSHPAPDVTPLADEGNS